MIVNFFFDNRIGGPHINIFRIFRSIKNTKITNVTIGKSKFGKINLINLRSFHKILYPLEIIINTIQIIYLFRYKKCVFISNSILNIAPIIAGSILGKKTYWYLLEEPNFFTKILFKFNYFFFKFTVLSISKKICINLNIKNYIYFPPYIKIKSKIKMKKINKKKLNIFSLGNINKVKNHYFAVDCLSNYKKQFNYTIIGAKINTQLKLYQSIKKLITDKKLNNIKLVGFKKQNTITNIIKSNDIFLLPSKTEGCPVSLIESMSMGKICICSKVGDIPMIIKSGFNGFLIDLNKKSLLRILNKIQKLNHKKLEKIQREAIFTIKNKFSNKKLYSDILKYKF